MSTLFSANADLPEIRTWPDFAVWLSLIHQGTGMSFADLEEAEAGRHRPGDRELRRGAVTDALSGRRPVRRALLERLLAAWPIHDGARDRVREVWRRLDAAAGTGPENAGRCRDAAPRTLGIHASIRAGESASELPAYVGRDFDDELRAHIAKGVDEGCFVLMVGGSSTGKTRSLYEAVLAVVPDWWLLQPAGTREVIRAYEAPTERTVLWLDELQNFLGADPPLTRAVLDGLRRAGMIIVGTLWSEEYLPRTALRRPAGPDKYLHDRQLLDSAIVIDVHAALSDRERETAMALAATDNRIREALESGGGTGLPQALAGAPALVKWWEHAPNPYAQAVITAAADARRLGVGSPLPEALLREAIEGYLGHSDRAAPPESWLSEALPHATTKLKGGVTALAPYARRAGALDGYVIADFLAQHIRRVHRTSCPPPSLWNALLRHVTNPDDLRRLAVAAQSRMRYRYAEAALRRLPERNDLATLDLAALLARQDRLDEAIDVLVRRMAVSPASALRDRHAELCELRSRADRLRPYAADALDELLTDAGRAATLRERADAGDALAAEELVDLLVDRGALHELRERADRGHRYAAEQLADLLAVHGRTAELKARAERDEAAARRYNKLMSDGASGQTEAAARQADALRARVDAGDDDAARELTALLFDLGAADALLAEVNAGTPGAIDRYLALLTAREETDRETLHLLRVFGINPDGTDAEGAP
ncbi:hypothetical protein [Catenuloplanes atrovinosus]|uniref:Uncharacterized protein n=1 Tax=Catenuloplanes atrovinosus TaxID=137266 RepID=A0AAE4CBG8_9ACTN|nr:hypothetical protein [Catenuloplanes atrovinosus]MDR7278007.1 hypothetical protein [Catenuloplanes atrovinosus]